MKYLYISEQGSKISINSHRIEVVKDNSLLASSPIEKTELISIFGNVQITTQCIHECMNLGIKISFFSLHGKYLGKLYPGHLPGVVKQRQQAKLYHNNEFVINIAKRIMEGKINNQRIILKRQSEYKQIDVVPQLDQLNVIKHKIWKSESLDQVLGYEGSAARIYFSGLNSLITSEFKFNGRSKRPPKDPFNALLSFGYTILFNEILGKIDAKGLNSYFGFIHQDKENHPTLASDLMEEWRPLIIDSVVMNTINNGDITRRNFTEPNENEGVYVNREGINMFISSVEDKLHSENKYLDYILEPISNRHAMELQVNSFVKAIELEDASVYHPIRIR